MLFFVSGHLHDMITLVHRYDCPNAHEVTLKILVNKSHKSASNYDIYKAQQNAIETCANFVCYNVHFYIIIGTVKHYLC